MSNRNRLAWFARGFVSTILFLLVATTVVRPLASRARSGDGEIPKELEGERGAPESNWEAMVSGDAFPSLSKPEGPAPAGLDDASPLVIPAADFSSDGNDPDGFYFDFAGGYVNGDGTGCLKAPAYLPHGATVTSVHASLYDNAPGNVMVNLRRVDVVSGSSDVMASFGTVTDSTSIQHVADESINDAGVSHPAYAYYVTTCLNYADHRLYSVYIYYTGP